MSAHGIDESRLGATLQAAGLPREQAAALLVGDPASLSKDRALALVTIDADSIQSTLLASPRPVTIFGASATLDEWDATLRDHDSSVVPATVTVLFAGGGNAVMLAPVGDATDIVEHLEAAFTDRMFARATGTFIEVSPEELVEGPRPLESTHELSLLGLATARGGFGGCMSNLTFALRRAKLSARPHVNVPEPTRAARCVETGDRPRERGARSRFAHAHWKRGREEKDQSVDHLRQARSLDDVAVRPGGRVAFVCIDGAKIGQLLVETKRVAEYAALSHRLHQAFSSVRDLDVSRVLGLETKKHQVVLAGGDDLLLVAPAEARGDYPDALELTRRIVRHIEEAFDDRVGVGAGVLITSGGIPARMAFDYARSLCNSAKSAISDEQRSAVDFELVLGGSPLSGGVLSRRTSDERSARFIRTQRPYGIHDFERLLRVAAELRKRRVGRAAITNLVRAVSQPEAVARIDAFYQLARDANLRAALGVEALDVAGTTEWLFAERDGGRAASRTVYTAVPDIALVHKLQGAR